MSTTYDDLPVSIRLPTPIIAKLDQLADSEDLKRSDLIRRAIREYLERQRTLPKGKP